MGLKHVYELTEERFIFEKFTVHAISVSRFSKFKNSSSLEDNKILSSSKIESHLVSLVKFQDLAELRVKEKESSNVVFINLIERSIYATKWRLHSCRDSRQNSLSMNSKHPRPEKISPLGRSDEETEYHYSSTNLLFKFCASRN